ncbi:MAG: hypothetical protein IT379_17505 [Deltaproteobacteria bacterium]|nr:hypothetical protein [Deltaproteobacteria bacterium]
MRSIAADEVRHAELSWQVGSWLATRLDDPERAHVRSARRVAARRLASDCLAPVDPVVARAAGLPSPPVAAAMVRAMTRTLWA